MKQLLLLFIFLLIVQKNSAQQTERFSLYMFNPTMINPAAAGSNGLLTVQTGYRNQWRGIDLAPQTRFVSVDGLIPTLRNKLGVGVIYSSYKVGLINNETMKLNLAYRQRLGDSSWFSIGPSIDLKRSTLDVTRLSILDATDNVYPAMNSSVYLPNISFGAFYFSNNKIYGVSVQQLMNNPINYSAVDRPITGKEQRHIHVLIGQYFQLNNEFQFKQLFLAKSDLNTPVQLDITPSIVYNRNLEIGFTYRHQQSIVAFLQTTFINQLKFGYAYDYETSALSTYTGGSHELMLSYTFVKNKKIMYNPRNF